MNYILNNKLKFEKNRYNKPVISPSPMILTRNINKNPPLPLKLDPRIPIQNQNISYIYSNPNIDFKLKEQGLNTFIQQIQPQYQKKSIPLEKIDLKYYKKDEIIINIYGYFDLNMNNKLYDFLLELSKSYKIKIYIHTWNIDKSKIDYYFQGLNVVSILIDNPEIDGTVDENIFSSNISLVEWKLMWTSMYRSMNEIYQREDDKTIILNTRFDINYEFINFENLLQNKFTKNVFLKNSDDLSGVDNPIIGDKNTLHKLIHTFYNNLDSIIKFYSSFKVPEASIYYENNRLFGVNYKDMFENIEKYSK